MRIGPVPFAEAATRSAAARQRHRAARPGQAFAAQLEAEALLGVERREIAALRQRCTWLEGEHHRLELALAAAEGRALHLSALTHVT